MLLRTQNYGFDGFNNQYFRRLLRVLRDESASGVDRLLAYRDALLASEDPPSAKLAWQVEGEPIGDALNTLGLAIDPQRLLSLTAHSAEEHSRSPVYWLTQRRFIEQVGMDPALKSKLRDADYSSYNGVAQQLAVRLAITTPQHTTIIVDLPTGCGKTLVAHAVSLYSTDSQLTVVIVPTISLAIEQGTRAAAMLKKAGLDHGGKYYWHGEQSKSEHDEIKERIAEHRQRVLFCSPEAACRSLLPTLFATARVGSLSSIVIDEAHIVDQWGAEFRPYFQILASLVRSLRRVHIVGIKCILMSATFTEKSIRLLEELFGVEGQECIQVNGTFLRPEIQYMVKQVSPHHHTEEVLRAVVAFPKPMIVYTVLRNDADDIYSAIRSIGVTRIGLFTGDTDARRREELLARWAKGELDIMVATSAFGLGMDKPDVRSIIHAAVPENLDRFYQEVGRGGRDGRACQSALIYFAQQIGAARKINRNRLITVELGLAKWTAMWKAGKPLPNGRRKVAVSAIRLDQQGLTESNEEWNWRTLLLMQRAGLIQIELDNPEPPPFDSTLSPTEYHQQLKSYYDDYYSFVSITPLCDDHLDESVWQLQTKPRRDYEKAEETRGLDGLLGWLNDPHRQSLCDILTLYYTRDGRQPEHTCGGCPHCLDSGKRVESPTVGRSVYSNAQKARQWRRPLVGKELHTYVYFHANGNQSEKRLLRNWLGWLVRMIESRAIQAIFTDDASLAILQTELESATGAFWIGDARNNSLNESEYWPQLVLHMNSTSPIPSLGWAESTKVLLAPETLSDEKNSNRRWWESIGGSMSLDTFLSGLNYGNH